MGTSRHDPEDWRSSQIRASTFESNPRSEFRDATVPSSEHGDRAHKWEIRRVVFGEFLEGFVRKVDNDL
ncbi:hypothetical protein CEXT_499731 [Caerostris extrusa]|uniref:Uncharacterized protein n=1 Tax=Caerostris extrusa TaxID=172846 RepID=A0AAV4MY26_CAEEX|nr:hypothetical protein CEXT_499731 [Caerostris extrusa]